MTAERSKPGRKEWVGLAVLALPTLVAAMDISVLFLALPRLSVSLHAGGVQQLWITDVYGFVLSGCLVTMGTLGDRVGSRTVLLAGGGAFGVLSAVAAFSTSPGMLIACRALLGVAGATLMPSGLALVRVLFADDRRRSMAVAVFISCVMAGGTAGLVFGGVALEYFWWGSCFLIGVPVMALLLVAGPIVLPQNRDPHAGRLDLTSMVLSLLAVLPIVYAIKEVARGGAEAVPLLVGATGVVFAVMFTRRQFRLADPLLDLRLFRDRIFRNSLLIMLVGSFLTSGIMLLFVQYLQMVKGLSPLRAGLCMIATSVALVSGILLAPIAARRVRPGYVIAAGLAIAVAGLGLLAQVGTDTPTAVALAGPVITNLGVGPFVTLATELVQGAVPPNRAGAAAAVSQTSGEGGVALGLAVLGTIGLAVYGGRLTVPSGVPAGTAATARQSIAGAAMAAARLPAAEGGRLVANAQLAFTTAMNTVAVIVAVLAALLAVVAATMLRDAKRPGDAGPWADDATHAPVGHAGADGGPAGT